MMVVLPTQMQFFCEWCGAQFMRLKAVKTDNGGFTAVGYCQKCGCDTWSREIFHNQPIKEPK